MEIVDICERIGRIIELCRRRSGRLQEFQTFLVQWKVTLDRLEHVGMNTNAVAVEVRQSLGADLERCERHLADGGWANKLNLKRARDEKEEAAKVQEKMVSSMQRLHTELMIAIHERDRQKYQHLLQAQDHDAEKLREDLQAQRRILREIQDGGEGDAAAIQSRIDQLKIQIGMISSMQTDTLTQINAGFQQVLSQGQDHFKLLSLQNAENLAAVQEGFAENRELHARVMAAVHTGTGDVLKDLANLQIQGGQNSRRIIDLLIKVLTEIRSQRTSPITEETVQAAMDGGARV